jgi:hypothetical protein
MSSCFQTNHKIDVLIGHEIRYCRVDCGHFGWRLADSITIANHKVIKGPFQLFNLKFSWWVVSHKSELFFGIFLLNEIAQNFGD